MSSALETSTEWVAVAISADMQYIYALQASGSFSFSTNSGASASFPVTQILYDIACSASGQYVVVTNYYNVYASTDFGSSWAVCGHARVYLYCMAVLLLVFVFCFYMLHLFVPENKIYGE
jgi:hypothetical protein